MSEDDDGSPLLDVLRSDTVGYLVGREPVHTQYFTPSYCHLGQWRTHTNGLETKLKQNLNLELKFSFLSKMVNGTRTIVNGYHVYLAPK